MTKLTFIGAGSMAEALISGIVANNLLSPEQIWATNRSSKERLLRLKDRYNINISYEKEELFDGTDIVILAMKPKDVVEAMNNMKQFLKEEMVIVSLLAGVSIESLESLAEKKIGMIRAMPNTSAAIGKSATALAANDDVTSKQKELVKQIFDTVGMTVFVEEKQLDIITGLSGSGPAYIYYVVEAVEKIATELGLDQDLAKKLIIQTLKGAAGMLERSEKEPSQLRKEVTSPGGTTEAGLKVLEKNHVQEAFIECIKAATARSITLGHELSKQIQGTNEKITKL